MDTQAAMIRQLTIISLMLSTAAVFAQTTATGTINATLGNKNGIAIVFDSDPAGVTLGATGTAAASLNFGTVSAFGPLSAGVSRPAMGALNYTIRTVFDVQVTQGGLTSTSYTLSAQLAAAAPAGLTYAVDSLALSTTA